ncbi:site-specific integrase [Pedobacter paludis]|uniref:Recombinase n=1 Tax=Pedobacter paludis TaxID=2203212 RepID=A0A317F3W3_9SPHI|nr:site-specific integrase [Pedobacter paludis]PWS32176.1 recombinase [Pedobacter paludis]
MSNDVSVFFFQKTPKTPQKIRYVYLRITVDGTPREKSTKRKWSADRWDQKLGRATGTKEDAKILNAYLDSKEAEVHKARLDLLNESMPITAQEIFERLDGRGTCKTTVLEEFKIHNDQMKALLRSEDKTDLDYAKGTHERYVTARSHVQDFIKFKYNRDDIHFSQLDYQFAKDYEFYLKTVRSCAHNTTLKYIANFKKIVLIAIEKKIIKDNPFARYKPKRQKIKKKALTWEELRVIEDYAFNVERLALVRDIFIFQCYTGLAYADVRGLTRDNIRRDNTGKLYIAGRRVKSKSDFIVPMLPTAIKIMNRYANHPDTLASNKVLPVISNQKMNAYLKEIGDLCGSALSTALGIRYVFPELNTHMARRTFASTVALNNGVPIVVVKEMLGHSTVQQTEDYAITEREYVHSSMQTLEEKIDERIKRDNQQQATVEKENTIEEIMMEMAVLQKKLDRLLFAKAV